MSQLLPKDFLQFLGSTCVLVGIVFALVSLWKGTGPHATRLLAIFVIIALALFADNWGCYFAGIFIIATAVTELDFLQNLAAIIRGNKDYFEYQKEFMSQKEVEESIVEEDTELEGSQGTASGDVIQLDLRPQQLNYPQFAMVVEEFAFKYLERKHGCSIQRHVRYKGKGLFTIFDGIMEREGRDIVFEVKSSRHSIPSAFIGEVTKRMLDRVRQYTAMTRRSAELHMVLVGVSSDKHAQKITDCEKEIRETEKDIIVSFEILTFSDIGLSQLEPKARDGQ